MRKFTKKFLTHSAAVFFVLLTFTVLVSVVCAQDITAVATVSATRVELGTALQLTVTINGADAVPPVQLPKIEGLETRYLGPSTRVSIINGKMSRSTGLMFTVIPLKTGQFEIPAVIIPINGQDYTTEAIVITVVDSGSLNSGQVNGSGQDSSSALRDKIFIVLNTAKKEAYLNEPIPLTIKLFIGDLTVKNVQYPVFEHEGFAIESFGEPLRGQQVLGGVNYQVMEFHSYIYPTRTGSLTLGPAKLGANILIKNSHGDRRGDGFGDFFGDDIFDNFLGRYETKTIMVESANIGLKISNLPDEGKPDDFSGGVGKYKFDMTVSPTAVKVGDPLTVRMRIAGDGNMKSVTFPTLKGSDDFKVYDPKILQQDGEKILEQVLIPKHDQVKELPAVGFSYFDPTDHIYRTVTQGPFALTVSPLAKGEEAKVVGITEGEFVKVADDVPEELGRDIRFIKETMGPLQKHNYILYRDVRFVFGFVFFGLIWLGLYVHFQYIKRLATDIRLARRLHAPRQARNDLAVAGRFLHEKNVQKFYDSIFKTLQEYLGNKFHLTSGVITVNVLGEHLKTKDHQDIILTSLREIFNECDLVRFASGQVLEEKMKSTFQRAQEAIDFFERNY